MNTARDSHTLIRVCRAAPLCSSQRALHSLTCTTQLETTSDDAATAAAAADHSIYLEPRSPSEASEWSLSEPATPMSPVTPMSAGAVTASPSPETPHHHPNQRYSFNSVLESVADTDTDMDDAADDGAAAVPIRADELELTTTWTTAPRARTPSSPRTTPPKPEGGVRSPQTPLSPPSAPRTPHSGGSFGEPGSSPTSPRRRSSASLSPGVLGQGSKI